MTDGRQEMQTHRRNAGRTSSATKVKGLAAFALASGLAVLMRASTPSANGKVNGSGRGNNRLSASHSENSK